MPRPIVDRLNKELRAMADNEQVKQRIQAEGGDPLTSSPEEYAPISTARRPNGAGLCVS